MLHEKFQNCIANGAKTLIITQFSLKLHRIMCHCVRGHKRHITTWICFLHILIPHAISQDGLAKEEKNVLKMQRSWIYCNIKPKKLNLSCRHGTCRLKLKGWKMLQERRENATTSGKNRFVTGCALVQFQIGFLYRTLSLKSWKKKWRL